MSEDIEAAVREAHGSGDLERAIQVGLSHYRAEIYSFLCARLRSEADAHDVFAQTSEDVWRGIAAFRWQCSFRTWLYTLARHAAVRFERSPANRAGLRQSLSRAPEAIDRERSRTRPYLRTDVKDRLSQLRETLTPDEQSLLVLRVDRGLCWEEVARVLCDDGEPDDASIRRHAVNLRQRFRQLTERIRERARAEGWLDEDG
jgi:RNA polymerase sigma-70 factor (ECF subfamily)